MLVLKPLRGLSPLMYSHHMLSGVVCMLCESCALRAVSIANARVVSGLIQQMESLQHMPVDEKKKKKKEKLGAQEA